jgi:hypothetical protein
MEGAQWRPAVRGAAVPVAFVPNTATAGEVRERRARPRARRRLGDLGECHAPDVADGG